MGGYPFYRGTGGGGPFYPFLALSSPYQGDLSSMHYTPLPIPPFSQGPL
jgi:hypothetical protein